ncbi:MAG: CRISPR-associated endonuclease Cas2 [Candidatus Brocadiae bacterium]|nr:CRISPR-associated endonuclease Cas2 [Myxococcota bacterium]NUN47430.1 CRISPR-associated endonuclease Cas2 [Candidatus Brocadiia bacterium]
MRTTYVVVYDVSDAKRLRLVHRTMRGFGDRIQYSVFRCELNTMERVLLEAKVSPLIHHGEDQVLIIPLGPPGGHNDSAIRCLGRPYVERERCVVVV